MIIINKDNIDFLIEKSRIRHTVKEEIIAVTNQLFEVQEIILQMESGSQIPLIYVFSSLKWGFCPCANSPLHIHK